MSEIMVWVSHAEYIWYSVDFLAQLNKMDKPGLCKSLQLDSVPCSSKGKMTQSKFITKAEVMEIVNDSDSDAYGRT
jgi:hypothetical protein